MHLRSTGSAYLTILIVAAITIQGCGVSGVFLGDRIWRIDWENCAHVHTYLECAIYAGWIFDMLLGFLIMRRWRSSAKYVVLFVYCGCSWFIAMQAHWFTDAPAACESKNSISDNRNKGDPASHG